MKDTEKKGGKVDERGGGGEEVDVEVKNRGMGKNSRSNSAVGSPSLEWRAVFRKKVMTVETIIIRLIGAPTKSRHNGINLNQQHCSQRWPRLSTTHDLFY